MASMSPDAACPTCPWKSGFLCEISQFSNVYIKKRKKHHHVVTDKARQWATDPHVTTVPCALHSRALATLHQGRALSSRDFPVRSLRCRWQVSLSSCCAHISYVTLGRLLTTSVPQFPPLQSGNGNGTCLRG